MRLLFGRVPCALATLVVAVQFDVNAPAFAQSIQCAPAGALAERPAEPPPSRPGEARRSPSPDAQTMQPVCPQGQVPLVGGAPQGGPVMKGNPLLRSQSGMLPGSSQALSVEDAYGEDNQAQGSPTCDGLVHAGQPQYCYYYNSVATKSAAAGAGMIVTVNRPDYFVVKGQLHTLTELAVQGGPDNGHVVEIGWRVANNYDDNDPHLFVFFWNGWDSACYDVCGWKQVSNRFFPRQNLSALVGQDLYIGWAAHDGNWWAFVNDEWIGYFPGELWKGQYPAAGLVQWYGEVATENGIPPRIQMGAGIFPTETAGGRMRDMCLFEDGAKTCDRVVIKNYGVRPRTAEKYYGMSRPSETDVRFGGPGQ